MKTAAGQKYERVTAPREVLLATPRGTRGEREQLKQKADAAGLSLNRWIRMKLLPPADQADGSGTKAAVQPFSEAHWLNQAGAVVKRKRWSAGVPRCNTNHPGFAWAARRELLDKHGIYTHGIAGSGDSFWTCAVYGWHDQTNHYLKHWHDPTLSTFIPWARAIYQDVRGHVGCVQGTVRHLPHGNAKGRQYTTKFRQLDSMKYDPSKHIHVGESGLLEWTDAAPEELREFLREFFRDRNDDVLV